MDIELHQRWLEFFLFFVPKVLYGLTCGALIGLERTLRNKSAGIKTNMLICVGSTIFTALSIYFSEISLQVIKMSPHPGQTGVSDPARLAAQIVSGVGFLGAGAIIQSKGNVVGLTTAATVWVCAALGVAVGMGFGPFAILITLGIVGALMLVTFIEDRFMGRSYHFHAEVSSQLSSDELLQRVEKFLDSNNLKLDKSKSSQTGTTVHMIVEYRGIKDSHNDFINDLMDADWTDEVVSKKR